LDIKLLFQLDGFLPYYQAASGAFSCRCSGGGLAAKIMNTWPDTFGALDGLPPSVRLSARYFVLVMAHELFVCAVKGAKRRKV
jgi:hypothetical protein